MCERIHSQSRLLEHNLQLTRGLDLFSVNHQQKLPYDKTEKASAMDDSLELLELAKKQYQQYLEIGQLCEATIDNVEEPVIFQSPGPETPLTTDENPIWQLDRPIQDSSI